MRQSKDSDRLRQTGRQVPLVTAQETHSSHTHTHTHTHVGAKTDRLIDGLRETGTLTF